MPGVEFLLETESHVSSSEHAHIIMTAPVLAWITTKLLQEKNKLDCIKLYVILVTHYSSWVNQTPALL